MGNLLRRTANGIDGYQQRHRWLAFSYATIRKFVDDGAGRLAALIAYYGFFSLFPLLLVLVSVVGLVLHGDPGFQHRVVNSALANFPVVGPDLRRNVHALSTHATLTLTVGTMLAIWAGLGVVRAAEHALNTVWNVPFRNRPSFVFSVVRGLLMLAVLGIVTVVAAGVAGVGAGIHGWYWTVAGIALSLPLNLLLFMLAFKILTSAPLAWSDVWPGAAVAAVVWTVLQTVGGYYVGHQLKGASSTYGTFAIVIGLLAWMYLGAQVTLFAAEVNVVKLNRLWPRSITREPPTLADERELERLAKVEERWPGQVVETTVPARETTAGGEDDLQRKTGYGVEEKPAAPTTGTNVCR
jgi:YihY family inner membrane protein